MRPADSRCRRRRPGSSRQQYADEARTAAAANTLEHLCWLATPRTDAPLKPPRPQLPAQLIALLPTAPEPPNDLQNDLLALSRELALPIPIEHVQAMSRAATGGRSVFKERWRTSTRSPTR